MQLKLIGDRFPDCSSHLAACVHCLLLLALAELSASGSQTAGELRFEFCGGRPKPGWVAVFPTNLYSAQSGYGFVRESPPIAGTGCVTSAKPFVFSVKLPEGNYRVTACFGSEASGSTNTVKTELRRLMVDAQITAAGEQVTRSFTVNIRTPHISSGDFVHLKPREKTDEVVNWDERLTLEFNGPRPCSRTPQIEPINARTVFLLGDSTVCDQPREPWSSWGQMLPRFLTAEVAVANHAESGESIKSSLSARRFEKVFSVVKPGDWLLLQFGHNDMKDRATNALVTYADSLRRIVTRTREKGALPVLITPMERQSGVRRNTLEGYPDAVREVSRAMNVALIDLNAMSLEFYHALGPNLSRAFQDGTHHNNYGSYELARCVVEGIRHDVPSLAKFLTADVPAFDPAHPDPVEGFWMPASPGFSNLKPDGN